MNQILTAKKKGRLAKMPRTDISIKLIRLDPYKPFGKQLKYYRELLNISLTEMGNRIGFQASNIYHLENNDAGYASKTNALTETALRYIKALGISKIEITL